MKEIKFRNLLPEDIDVRPATIKDGKATLLCYIDSRSVVSLLDEAVGPLNWNMEFEEVGGQIVGKLGVWDEDKQTWVVKSDTGSESNIEAGKGLFSDCYKRCIARWGLQDLYTIPKIIVSDDGYGCRYHVGEVIWNDRRECTHITLVNKFGKVMYRWDKDAEVKSADEARIQEPVQLRKDKPQVLKEFCSAIKKQEGIDKEDLLRFYQYWLPRVENWDERPFIPEKLWSRWCQTKRN